MEGKDFSALVGTALYLREKDEYKDTNFYFTTEVGGVKAKFHSYGADKISIRLKGYGEISDDDLEFVRYEEENVKRVLEGINEYDGIKDADIDKENVVSSIDVGKYKDDTRVRMEIENIPTRNLILVVDGDMKLELNENNIKYLFTKGGFQLDGGGKIEKESTYPKGYEVIGDVTFEGKEAEKQESKSFKNDCRLLKKYIRLEATIKNGLVFIKKKDFKSKFEKLKGRLFSESMDKFEENFKKEQGFKNFSFGNSSIEIEGLEFTVHNLDDEDATSESNIYEEAIDDYFKDNASTLYELYESVKKKVKFKRKDDTGEVKFLKGFNELFAEKVEEKNIKISNEAVVSNKDLLQAFRKRFKNSMSESYGKDDTVFGHEVELKKDQVEEILKGINEDKRIKNNDFISKMIKNSKILCNLINKNDTYEGALGKIKERVQKDFGSTDDSESRLGKSKVIKEKKGELKKFCSDGKKFDKVLNLLERIEGELRCLFSNE